MGGIAAFVADNGALDGGNLKRMLAAVPHRGGIQELAVTGRTALGVVHGPDHLGASLDASDGITVAFTGVLDNATELASSIGQPPGVPASSTASLLARAYRRFGDDLPTRLRGVYSAVVSDGRQLFCFRDHLGLDSLFYRRDGAGCWVASEAKQVVAGAGICREPNLDVIERIFFQAAGDENLPSSLQGVDRLPKRTRLVTDGRTLRTSRYWDPASLLETARPSAEEIQGRFDELMTQAARRVVTGNDVVALSGGIDSPAVAAFASPIHLELAGTPLQALTFVYPDHPAVDERRYAELSAEQFGLPLHTWVPTAGLFDGLQEWMRLTDGPVGVPSLAGYEELYRGALSLGSRNLLSGECAECVNDSYNWILVHLLTHGRFGALRDEYLARRARGISTGTFARVLLTPLGTRLSARWWGRQELNVPDWMDVRRVKEAARASLVPAARRWERGQVGFVTHPNLAFEAEAACQQVFGVRVRRPWIDVDLWEYLLSLPAELRFPPSPVRKDLVRKLLRGKVPDPVLDRRDKTVFNQWELDNLDYAAVEKWVVDPPCRIGGVDYELLAERLQARPPAWLDYRWARSLASVQAYLSTW